MKLYSLRLKIAVLLVALVTISILAAGIFSTLYYKSVIEKNIWNDALAESKALSNYTDNFIGKNMPAHTPIDKAVDGPTIEYLVSESTGKPAIYIGVPMKSENGSVIGTLAGEIGPG